MLKAPIPFLGSKRLEINHIIECQPNFKKIIDVFGGGGSVSLYYFQKGYNIQYNDICPVLFELFEAIQEDTIKDIVDEVCDYKLKDDLKEVLEKYNNDNDLISFLILKSHSYRGLSTTSLINRRKIKGELVIEQHYKSNKLLKYPEIFKEKKMKVSNLNYKIILEKHKNNEDTFLYLDPPYLSSDCSDYVNGKFTYDDILYIEDYIKIAKCKVMLHIEFTGYVYHKFKDYIKKYYPKRYALSGKNMIYQKYVCIICNY
jgi:site-specific DNA-adenine methylase